MTETAEVTVALPDELLDAIALRAARIVAEQILEAERDAYEGYLPPAAAAHYIGATSRQRIYQRRPAGARRPRRPHAAVHARDVGRLCQKASRVIDRSRLLRIQGRATFDEYLMNKPGGAAPTTPPVRRRLDWSRRAQP